MFGTALRFRDGSLIASDIAGSTLGAAACGWLLLPVLGTAGTLKLLVAMGALIAFPYARLRWRAHPRRRAATTLAALALTGTAVLAMPAGQTLSRPSASAPATLPSHRPRARRPGRDLGTYRTPPCAARAVTRAASRGGSVSCELCEQSPGWRLV